MNTSPCITVDPGAFAFSLSLDGPITPKSATGTNDDIPPAIRYARKSVQKVYRIIRDHEGDGLLCARHILAEYERREGDWEPGESTIHQAVTQLKRLGLARKTTRGWRLSE